MNWWNRLYFEAEGVAGGGTPPPPPVPPAPPAPEPPRSREADLRAELAAERVSKRDLEGKLTELSAKYVTLETSTPVKIATEVDKEKARVTKMQGRIIDAELRAAGTELGIQDPDLLLHPLLDRSAIKVDDEGVVTGVKEAFEALKTKKPDWFKPPAGSPPPPPARTGNPTPPNPGGTPPAPTDVTKMTPEQYKEHKAQMRRSLRAVS
jgi:hypothetical protein